MLDGIQCNNALLQDAMVIVRSYRTTGGKTDEFMATYLYLLPHDPVSNNRALVNKIAVDEISDTYGADTSLTSARKSGIGKTGV